MKRETDILVKKYCRYIKRYHHDHPQYDTLDERMKKIIAGSISFAGFQATLAEREFLTAAKQDLGKMKQMIKTYWNKIFSLIKCK